MKSDNTENSIWISISKSICHWWLQTPVAPSSTCFPRPSMSFLLHFTLPCSAHSTHRSPAWREVGSEGPFRYSILGSWASLSGCNTCVSKWFPNQKRLSLNSTRSWKEGVFQNVPWGCLGRGLPLHTRLVGGPAEAAGLLCLLCGWEADSGTFALRLAGVWEPRTGHVWFSTFFAYQLALLQQWIRKRPSWSSMLDLHTREFRGFSSCSHENGFHREETDKRWRKCTNTHAIEDDGSFWVSCPW